MKIQVHRFANGRDSTLGMLRLDDKSFECFVLEDQYQAEKKKGETRIPAGKYQVKFREEPSPLTTKYRNRYTWFNFHLEIQNVPNFKYVYIHVGNTDDHTDGCLLVGMGALKYGGEYTIQQSVNAYRDLYAKIKAKLNADEKVYIEISSF